MIEKGKCPICGKNNGCAMVAGTDPYKCWCMTNPVPKILISHIPDEFRNQSCICHDCIKNYNKKVCVIGSLNVDTILNVENFAKPGQTIKAKSLETFYGGKGGNQAIAASKLGLNVSMLACVGSDQLGQEYLKHLETNKIKTHLIKKSSLVSGQAFIEVDEKGENKIVTIGGANYDLSIDWINNHIKDILDHDYFLMSLEIPNEVSLYLLSILKENNKVVILDPAPYSNFDAQMLDLVTYVTPNETEYEQLKSYLMPDKNIILKKGSKGSTFNKNDISIHLPPYKVEVVDTVGAGDTFNAAVCFGIVFKLSIEEVLFSANIAGALATTQYGAQAGMPTLEKILKIKHTSI